MAQQNKITVAVLFGGRSAEHEVSLQSARNILKALDRNRFEPLAIGVDKSGRWLCFPDTDCFLNADDPNTIALKPGGQPVVLLPEERQRSVMALDGSGKTYRVDVVFPIIHGTYGEDGTLQGLLRLADMPFVGPDVAGSAASMDKDLMKRLLRDAGIPVADYFVVHDYDSDERKSFAYATEQLGTGTWFVKPANLGSSVGIRKVSGEPEYLAALEHAFQFDSKLIVECGIVGREIECAVLGNQNPQASELGEVIPAAKHGFYSYEAKYLDAEGAGLVIPAEVPEGLKPEIQKMAIRVFQVMECSGLSRVDFFLQADGKILVNELNTLPGFTKISMYPALWQQSGLAYSDLITRLVELAIDRQESRSQLKTVRQ